MSNSWKILAFGIIGFFGYKAVSARQDGGSETKETNTEPPTEPENNTQNQSPKMVYVNQAADSFPLKLGSKGAAVVSLQKLLIEYSRLKNLSIAKTDPMRVDSNGNPDGIFGQQTQRWSAAILNSTSVSLAAYNWLFTRIAELKKAAPAKPQGYKIGDLVYAKGSRSVTRYRSSIEIKSGNLELIPTFDQFVAYLKKGNTARAMDKVEFAHGEVIGRIAHIADGKYRIVVTKETDHHVWWVQPLRTHKDYFIFSSDQFFK